MAANHDRGALEDLEAMLDRSLKIKASPPHWNPVYRTSPGHAPPSQRDAPPLTPSRAFPPRVPLPNSYNSSSPPQAVYHSPHGRNETQAVPNPTAALGMRSSASLQSISSSTSLDPYEHQQQQAQHQQQHQQAQQQAYQHQEQQRLDMYRRERLIKLEQQQQQQERELEMLRARELHARQQQVRQQQEQQLYQQQHQMQLEQQMHDKQLHEKQLRDQQQLRERQEEDEAAKQREALEKQEEASRIEAAKLRQRQLEAERARENRLEREGAATMVQRMQDSHGNVTTRVVKKGVEDFAFKEELGTGSYSTVVAAQDKQTLRQYAIKVLDKAHIIKEQKVKYVEIEKHTLNRLGDHPGIIRLYFTFQDRQSLYFVLDFAPNGELLHLIKRIGSLNEECARYYACQLLDAVEYMHSKGVIHRDLKPENILLDYKMRIKITDFGTAKLLDADSQTGAYPTDARANSFVGTAEYVTPELLVGKSQNKSADIWAWGCVLYQMIAAVPPFQGNTQYLTFQKIARLQYSIPPGFPYVVRDLLRHVLVKPHQRWSINEIKQHEFFHNQDWSQKAVWSNPPPKLQPYKASVASMKPRPMGGKNVPKVIKPAPSRPHMSATSATPAAGAASNGSKRPQQQAHQPQQQQQVFVPTAAGLQSLNPSTLYGMPVSIRKSSEQLNSKPQPQAHPQKQPPQRQPQSHSQSQSQSQSQPVKKPSQSANAASAALYKTAPAHTSAYQQSQERISALKRRMQEQRLSGRSTSGSALTSTSPSVSASASASASAFNRPGTPGSPVSTTSGASLPSIDTRSGTGVSSPGPISPSLAQPPLPQPPLTQIESQFSNILVSAQERILKVGRMGMLVSTHLPPQAQSHHPSKSGTKATQSSQAAPSRSASRHSRGNGSIDVGKSREDEIDVAFSYDDDSLFSKLFLTKNKSRLVLVTTCGRLLIMADERKILYEVPLGLPQIEVSEIPFQVGGGRTTKIVVQTYNKVLTLDDPGHIGEWMGAIDLSKRYYAQLTADQERNAFNAAAAAASAVAGRRH